MKTYVLNESKKYIYYKVKNIDKKMSIFTKSEYNIKKIQFSKKKYGEILIKHSHLLELSEIKMIKDKIPYFIKKGLTSKQMWINNNDYIFIVNVKFKNKKLPICFVFHYDKMYEVFSLKTFYPVRKAEAKRQFFTLNYQTLPLLEK